MPDRESPPLVASMMSEQTADLVSRSLFASETVVDFGPIKSKRSLRIVSAASDLPNDESGKGLCAAWAKRAADESGADCYGCFCKKG